MILKTSMICVVSVFSFVLGPAWVCGKDNNNEIDNLKMFVKSKKSWQSYNKLFVSKVLNMIHQKCLKNTVDNVRDISSKYVSLSMKQVFSIKHDVNTCCEGGPGLTEGCKCLVCPTPIQCLAPTGKITKNLNSKLIPNCPKYFHPLFSLFRTIAHHKVTTHFALPSLLSLKILLQQVKVLFGYQGMCYNEYNFKIDSFSGKRSMSEELLFCGFHSPFVLYLPSNNIALTSTCKSNNAWRCSPKHYVEMTFTVVDVGVVQSMNTSKYNLSHPLKDLIQFGSQYLSSYHLVVRKNCFISLDLNNLSNSNRVIDGPTKQGEPIECLDNKCNTTTFQGFVILLFQRKFKPAMQNICFLSVQIISVNTTRLRTKEKSVLCVPHKKTMENPLVIHILANQSFYVKITTNKFESTVPVSHQCTFGGLAFVDEVKKETEDLTLCESASGSKLNRHYHSQESSLFVVLYWYLGFGSIECNITAENSKCVAINIDPCVLQFHCNLDSSESRCSKFLAQIGSRAILLNHSHSHTDTFTYKLVRNNCFVFQVWTSHTKGSGIYFGWSEYCIIYFKDMTIVRSADIDFKIRISTCVLEESFTIRRYEYHVNVPKNASFEELFPSRAFLNTSISDVDFGIKTRAIQSLFYGYRLWFKVFPYYSTYWAEIQVKYSKPSDKDHFGSHLSPETFRVPLTSTLGFGTNRKTPEKFQLKRVLYLFCFGTLNCSGANTNLFTFVVSLRARNLAFEEISTSMKHVVVFNEVIELSVAGVIIQILPETKHTKLPKGTNFLLRFPQKKDLHKNDSQMAPTSCATERVSQSIFSCHTLTMKTEFAGKETTRKYIALWGRNQQKKSWVYSSTMCHQSDGYLPIISRKNDLEDLIKLVEKSEIFPPVEALYIGLNHISMKKVCLDLYFVSWSKTNFGLNDPCRACFSGALRRLHHVEGCSIVSNRNRATETNNPCAACAKIAPGSSRWFDWLNKTWATRNKHTQTQSPRHYKFSSFNLLHICYQQTIQNWYKKVTHMWKLCPKINCDQKYWLKIYSIIVQTSLSHVNVTFLLNKTFLMSAKCSICILFTKYQKLKSHFWWPKNCVNILENCKSNAPKRYTNQSSTFAKFTFLCVTYLYFVSKFTFSEMKSMKTICSKLTFLYLKTGHASFGSFTFLYTIFNSEQTRWNQKAQSCT